jgi:hypothetical protein
MSKKYQSSKKGSNNRKLRMLSAVAAAAPLAIGVPAAVSAAESPVYIPAPSTGVQAPNIVPPMPNGGAVEVHSNFTPIEAAIGGSLKVGEYITVDLDEFFEEADGFLVYVQNPSVADVTTLSGELYIGAKREGTTLVNVTAYDDEQHYVGHERFRLTVDPNPSLDADGNGFDIRDAAKALQAMGVLPDAVKKEAARTVLRSAESFLAVPNRAPEAHSDPIELFVPESSRSVLYMDDFFSDPDGDLMSYALVGTPSSNTVASFSFDQVTGLLIIDAYAYNTGSTSVTVRATDADGLSVTQQFQVKLANRELPPSIGSIEDQMTNEDTPLTLTVSVRDDDGDSVTLTASSSKESLIPSSGIQITGTGDSRTITVTPAANQIGNAVITLFADDGKDGKVSKSFMVTVNPVNDAPVASAALVELVLPERSNNLIQMNDFFTDPDGDVLTYSVVGSLPSSSTVAEFGFDPDYGTLTINAYTYNTGSSTVTIRATDADGLSVTQKFQVKLDNVELPPSIESIEDQVTDEDTPLTLTASVRDYDGDSVTLTASSNNQTLIPNSGIQIAGTGDSRSVTITPAADQHGTAVITLTASDGELTDSATFNLTVIPVNDAPILLTDAMKIGVLNNGHFDIRAGQTAIVDLTEIFTDVDSNSLTYEFVAPGVMYDEQVASYDNINAIASIHAGYPSGSIYSYTVRATDEQSAFSEHTITATVVPGDDLANMTFSGEDTITIDLSEHFDLPAGGDWSIHVDDKYDDGHVLVSESNGILSLTRGTPGIATLIISVEDGHGGTIIDSFEVTNGYLPNDIGTQFLWYSEGEGYYIEIDLSTIFIGAESYRITSITSNPTDSMVIDRTVGESFPNEIISLTSDEEAQATIEVEATNASGETGSYTLQVRTNE